MGSLQALLLVLCAGFRLSQAQCPTGCNGCGDSFVSCGAAGLNSFPQFSLADQQLIEDLILQSNQITSLSAVDLENFTSLETLDFSFNGLTFIEPGSFQNTTELTSLSLNDNEITQIPDNLFTNTQLRTLDLSENSIQNISADTFRGLVNFATINLESNRIQTIPNGTFSELESINELVLTDNPLLCDCKLRWLPAFLVSVPFGDSGTCDAPTSVSGVAVDSLVTEDFVCVCNSTCINGTCDLLSGVCECNDGYVGIDCSTVCPPDTYGAGCQQNCSCTHESSPCNAVDGTCNCLPGYTGVACEIECPEGFYGQDCLEECQCQNDASCDFITGMCSCTAGWMGPLCDMMCPIGLYGLGCNESCTCETGNCHHITGNCSCSVGFFGTNCSHNCSGALDCAELNRAPCSLETPEQTCGSCLDGHVGEEGDGNTQCILCSGAPDCAALNRYPCSEVTNTCGTCFERHFGTEGFSNDPCFDPCANGVLDYEETDTDCGGSLCPSCELGEACTSTVDCGMRSVCLGLYVHPSMLEYPFDTRNNNTCVEETYPGNAIIQRFKDSLLGRENPLSDLSPLANQTLLEDGIQNELEIQFDISGEVSSVEITHLQQAPGDPLYQTNIRLRDASSVERSFEQMVENMNSGKLKGTLLLNKDDRKALLNI